VKEALKTLRKNYELGSDVVLMDINSKKYDDNERMYKYRKNLWLGRKRTNKSLRACRIVNHRIIVEVNGVETTFDGKICSIWNLVAVCKYLSMLTGLKNHEFRIWINGIEWEDKWSFGAIKSSYYQSSTDGEENGIFHEFV
jgi:hypothetical protein